MCECGVSMCSCVLFIMCELKTDYVIVSLPRIQENKTAWYPTSEHVPFTATNSPNGFTADESVPCVPGTITYTLLS